MIFQKWWMNLKRYLLWTRETCFRFEISELSQEIRSCNPGDCVDLKPFFAHDGKTRFLLKVYPNGNREENRGHISINLENVSGKFLYCDYEIQVSSPKLRENIAIRVKERFFSAPCSLFDAEPWPYKEDKIFKHATCKSWLDFHVNTIVFYCTISRIFTEFDGSVQKNSPQAPSFELQSILLSIESQMSDMMQLNRKLMIKLEKQEKEKSRHNNIPVPECPVCFEPLNKSPKIAQCVLGHLLCWNCKQRLELEDCPTCKGPVCGRAFGMENYLKTLFPTPGEFQFLADKARPGAVVIVVESRIDG